MLKLLSVLAAFIIIACQPASAQFTVKGHVSGYKDSTQVYLRGDVEKDSTYLIGGKFKFTGKTAHPAERWSISIAGTPDYKFFWIENGEISFTATKGNFRRAEITGSKTQLEDDKMQATIADLHAARDKTEGQAAFDSIQSKIFDKYGEFIAKNPNSLVGAEFLAKLAPSVGKVRTEKMYRMLSTAMKNTDQGKVVAKFLSVNIAIEMGKPFVNITQYTTLGRPVKLSQYKGNVILIDFWASWCKPCRAQNPELVKVYNSYKAKGFKVFAVSVDDKKSNWLAAVKKDATPFINVSEKNGGKNKANLVYGIDKYPSNYLIDAKGIIIGKDLEPAELGKVLEKIYN